MKARGRGVGGGEVRAARREGSDGWLQGLRKVAGLALSCVGSGGVR